MTQHAPSPSSAMPHALFSPTAPGVERLAMVFVNLYAVEVRQGQWVLVDTGLPNLGWYVRKAIDMRFGSAAKPAAIVLTHGHFDHAGNAQELADAWHVPVYAHRQEMPYLTGGSDYPPQDPTPGGAISFLSRFFPRAGRDLGARVQEVPEDGSIPQMPGWRWIATPGHTAGHISLLRESDRLLLAGDAVLTVDLDCWSSQFTWPRKLSRPPTPLTPDWSAARQSIFRLAELSPATIASGHGLPMSQDNLAQQLRDLAERLHEPDNGRYSHEPARYARDGSVAAVPPPVPDPLPRKIALGGLAAAAALGLLAASKLKRDSDPS